MFHVKFDVYEFELVNNSAFRKLGISVFDCVYCIIFEFSVLNYLKI